MKNQFFTRAARYFTIGFVLLALVLGSCNKEDDEEEGGESDKYMISFKANGTLQEFTSDHFPMASFYDNGTQYNCLVTGTRSASRIGVEAMDKKPIIETTYTGYAITQATQTPAYVVGAAISYSEGQTIYITPYENPDVKVEITKITETTVQGKFNGTLKSSGKPDLVITEGKFLVATGAGAS